jgi:hypothetical protein
MLGFYSEGRSLIQTSCPSPLVSPRKVPSVWHHTTIGEQTLQFRAAIGVWNGTVKWVSLELLYTKRTKASIWIFLELRPDRGFTFQSCLLCCRCSWGTWEEEPFFWESECRSMQLCEPFFFKVIAYDLSNKMFRFTDQQTIRSLRVDWKSRKRHYQQDICEKRFQHYVSTRKILTVIFCGYVPVSSLKRQTLNRRFSKLSRACSSVSARLLTLSSFPVQVHTKSDKVFYRLLPEQVTNSKWVHEQRW